MKLAWFPVLTLAAALGSLGSPILLFGCSGSSNGNIPGGNGSGSDGGVTNNDPPHALGTIVLGEAHTPGGASTPLVSAAFVPDSAKAASVAACTVPLAGCTVPVVPRCDGRTAPTCATGEVCTLDATCHSTCTKACTLTCGSDEECYLATPTSPACRKVETFNAGALAFAGTTTPITLYPPYSFVGETSGSPFLAGAQIEVQGSGATSAGFDHFDETFHATTFVQTLPSLDKTPLSQVWGSGAIPVGWVPGTDDVVVEVTGVGGTAECPAVDATGHFDVPRVVVAAVTAGGSQSLSIAVTRERVETKKDAHTKGSLSTATVQSVGFLQLTTSSSEMASFQGCTGTQVMCGDHCADLSYSATDCGACGHSCGNGYCSSGTCYGTTTGCTTGQTLCNGTCVDTTSSATNCGQCGHVCATGQTCSSSVCVGGTTTCASCEATAETGTCSTLYSTCSADAECMTLKSCIGACAAGDQACHDTCYNAHPNGYTNLYNYQQCVCNTACSTPCTTDKFCSAI
jgi:hypothetical protein